MVFDYFKTQKCVFPKECMLHHYEKVAYVQLHLKHAIYNIKIDTQFMVRVNQNPIK